MTTKSRISALLAAALLLPLPAYAQAVDRQIEGAKLCTRNLARYERQFGIPMHLLSAISATESGRYHQGLKLTLPWPWTINVEGQGHYYDSKEEAIAAVRRYQMQGARSIDVGCMQVNLIHHPDAFANLDEAFDPEHNVAYGASFLRSLYEENKSWKQASANYHSKTPQRGTEYVSRVYDRWTTILDRLREAKVAVSENTELALNEKMPAARPVELARADEPKTIAVKPTFEASRSKSRMNAISIRTIDASSRDTRDGGVLVIRPKVTVVDDAASVVAVNAPVAAPQPGHAQVIHVAAAQPETVASGPRFIFEN
ncbi:MAG: transglycosylase SLT domain-containing protein [Alphaproteobacteria bacterium]|nr:transglycosylase SLT domain-containing protein [Alphaproteobacteria bacterium]